MRRGHNYYVYILKCSDGLYYTGVTNDIERRLWEHNSGFSKTSFTYKRRPVELVYLEHFDDINKAIPREKQLKGWSRKKKEAMIAENWELVKELAKKKR
ncbi:MAG: GIY-YIG nuclease family protein [Sphingobacteriales bacterium]|nr:GIY-YIG nuclease family protein [Sphingobacteriales bacterium]